MNDIKYKQLLTFAIPYLAICGGLWQYSYWSTFDTNILLNLNSVDIVKSFIFPFTASAGFYFLGHILSLFIMSPFAKKLEPSQTTSMKTRRVVRIIIEISLILIFIASLISKANEKWIVSSLVLSLVTYLYLIDKGFFMKVIPDMNIQKKVVFTVILVPFLCFGFAKTNSLNILDNKLANTELKIKTTKPDNFITEKVKILGFVGDFVVCMKLDKNNVIMYPKSEISKIEFIKNLP